MTKKEKTQIGIILCSVLLIVVAIIGNTYAYFTSTITGNDTAKDTVITTGTMKIVYTNTQEIKGEKLLPGWKSEEKTFTVENTGTLPVMYNINLTDVTNIFSTRIDNVTGKPEELVYTLTGDNEINIEEEQFPTTNDNVARKITIEPNTTHTYTMQVTFKELGVAQDYNQGREFAGKIEIEEVILAKAIAMGEDNSGANAPELNNGLIPVIWNGKTWEKADTTKAWYNYDKQVWANAVTVSSATRDTYTTAPVETEIKMEDIETMWVWVPRYEYQHTNLSTQYAGGTKELPGEIEINFLSKDVTTPSSSNFTVHDAFWWDDNNDGVKDASEQLSGIWVAKFEMSTGATECTPATVSVGTGCDITTIAPQIKPNVTSWRGARIGTLWTVVHEKMNGADNTYGLTNSDTHLMKNMEFGAVAYLSQSKYGKYGNANYIGANKEIYQNKSTTFVTGSSNGTPSVANTLRNIQSSYDTEEKGTGASTTGNIYGIYDMSGGAFEHVMGIMKESTNTEPAVGNGTTYNSGWSGKIYNAGEWTEYIGTYGQLKDIGSKYYDLYDYGTDRGDLSRYHKGDATYETKNWYSDQANFVFDSSPFFVRGGNRGTQVTGVFAFVWSTGHAIVSRSGRPALVQTN